MAWLKIGTERCWFWEEKEAAVGDNSAPQQRCGEVHPTGRRGSGRNREATTERGGRLSRILAKPHTSVQNSSRASQVIPPRRSARASCSRPCAEKKERTKSLRTCTLEMVCVIFQNSLTRLF